MGACSDQQHTNTTYTSKRQMSMQLTAAAALAPTRQLLQMLSRCLSTQAWGKSKPQDPLKTNKDIRVRLGGRLGCSLNEDTNDFLLTINDDIKKSLYSCFHKLHQSSSSKSMSGRLPSIGLKCTNPAGLSTTLKIATRCRIQCWTLPNKTFDTPAGVPFFHDPHFWNSLQVDKRPWRACLSLSHTKGHTNQQWIREVTVFGD